VLVTAIFLTEATVVIERSPYGAAQEWLLEDEYEQVKGQLFAEEIF
jgi:hypothetical protein